MTDRTHRRSPHEDDLPSPPPPGSVILASDVLGQDRRYGLWVLSMRVARTGAWAMITFGLAVAVMITQSSEIDVGDIESPSGFVDATFSPLALLMLGLIVRLVVLAPVAYLVSLTAVLHRGVDIRPREDGRSRRALLVDRLRLAGAGRSLIWTSAVKHQAVERLGDQGPVMVRLEIGARVLAGIGVVAALVAAALVS